MRIIKSVEMANNNEVFSVGFGERIKVKPCAEDGFAIFIGDEEADWRLFRNDAKEDAKKYIIDEHLVISGYGTNAGKKFWQLSEELREEIVTMAINA